MSDEPQFRPEGQPYEVDAPLGLSDLRARLTKTGEHLWTVKLVFRIDDPETALDDMMLGPHNMVDAERIRCFWCSARYVNPHVPSKQCLLG